MKLLILYLVLLIWSQQVLTLQTSTNVWSNSLKSPNPILSLGGANTGAFEKCRKEFPEDKIDPASSYYINDGCTVTCLIGTDQWHKLPNQIGKPCPFNLRGTCDTNGRCHNEGPIELGQLSLKVDQADLHYLQQDERFYFVVAHIRNSSEPWPLASMDYADSSAHCITPTKQGPQAVWRHTCDKLSSFLFKDTSRIFLYVYAHEERDPYNNVEVGSASATIFEILQGDRYNAAFELENVQAMVWIKVNFTPTQSVN